MKTTKFILNNKPIKFNNLILKTELVLEDKAVTDKCIESFQESVAEILSCKWKEYLQLCECSIAENYRKSTIYGTLLFGIELYIKWKLTLENVSYEAKHNVFELIKLGNNFDNRIFDCLDDLMKNDNFEHINISSIKYNIDKNKKIILSNDIADDNFKKKVVEIIKWIRISVN